MPGDPVVEAEQEDCEEDPTRQGSDRGLLRLDRSHELTVCNSQLDAYYNPGLSKVDLQKAKKLERERQKRKKAKKKQKAQDKESESDTPAKQDGEP